MGIVWKMWSFLHQLFRWIAGWIQRTWTRATGPTIEMDTGISVRVGKKIAEGGFSFVFEAYGAGNNSNGNKKYALKRIHVGDREALQGCQREAGVHRSLPKHPNLMPLLGTCHEKKVLFYMLFPHMPRSLRSVVNNAVFHDTKPPHKPFTELRVLQLIHQIMAGVSAMHDSNYSHRDIKLENILLDGDIPVLMDFGSAGPLEAPLATRQDVLTLVERASQHTTLSYRPPELLEAGGVRCGDPPIDYAKVDVWSLGCALFAMCFGASPFECDFRAGGRIRIVEATPLRILGKPPSPPADWYSQELLDAVQLLLTADRHRRPTLDEAAAEIEALIQKMGGRVPKPKRKGAFGGGGDGDDDDDGDSDLDALLSSNRFV